MFRNLFDVRQGEHRRLWSMFFYLLFVLFAYYVVKPVSRAMFLTKFDVDKLPLLYILIAIFGGILAYFYSKVASKVSLQAAVTWAMGLSILTLIALWWLITLRLPWMVYVLNIWVSLFSVILVSQGWLVASNLFDSREAKRLYPLLDMGMVLGAAFGGEFTKRTAVLIGTESLLLASAALVLLAYLCFLIANRNSTAAATHTAGKEDDDFSFVQMIRDVTQVRHMRIIVGMMIVMYLVDTLVEYQFQATARAVYTGDNLTAFFGQFYGLWLNAIEFVFQLFLTSIVVRWFGVGATLQISPLAVGVSSIATVVAPGLYAASAVRLTEASTRYTLSKTGMELLYMPLPLALRNRIKAFVDICVDRLSRGIGGVLLIFLTTGYLHLGVKGISVVVIVLSAVWVVYAQVARREYVNSIRRKLETRRLDFKSERLTVSDASTIHLLENTAHESNVRQATYALSLLSEAPKYDVKPLLERLVDSPVPAMREKVYEIASGLKYRGLLPKAIQSLEGGPKGAPCHAISYVLTLSESRKPVAQSLLNGTNLPAVQSTLDGLRVCPDLARELLTNDWIEKMAAASDPQRRRLAAAAIAVRGDTGIERRLHFLLDDSDPCVVREALKTAGELKGRTYLYPLIDALGKPRVRLEAIRALCNFGPLITGTLSDVLADEQVSTRIKKQIPRVLTTMPDSRSVTVLLSAIGHPDLHVRTAALKALNRLRETAPDLHIDDQPVTDRLLDEARLYYELTAALAPFHAFGVQDQHRATRLLVRTIEDRLKDTLARLFRLLGLRYPPKDIFSAYLAVSRPGTADTTSAVEFLDTVLDRHLKSVLLPLLDAPQFILDRGRELFGVKQRTAAEAIQAMTQSEDPWITACAVAAAQELGITTGNKAHA